MRRSRAIMQTATCMSTSSTSLLSLSPISLSSISMTYSSMMNSPPKFNRAPLVRNTISIVSQSPLMNSVRTFATEAGLSRESQMKSLLIDKLQATVVDIKDVSGGCGDFYQILVVSPLFQGVTRIVTHRMVNEVLEKYIGKMHGLTLRTLTPEQYTALTTKK